jgi:hypothetical protein
MVWPYPFSGKKNKQKHVFIVNRWNKGFPLSARTRLHWAKLPTEDTVSSRVVEARMQCDKICESMNGLQRERQIMIPMSFHCIQQ